MRELNAYLRVEGLSDEESKALPTQIDAESLGADGHLHLADRRRRPRRSHRDPRPRDGGRAFYDQLPTPALSTSS